MTPEELDRALADVPSGDHPATQGRPQSVPAMGTRAVDFESLVSLIPAPLPDPSAKSRPRWYPPTSIPKAHRVSAAALRSRLHAKLWAALETMSPAERYGCLFLGPTGCGKSSAAAYAALRWHAAHNVTPEKPDPMWCGNEPRHDVEWLDAIRMTDAERRYRLGSGDPEALKVAFDVAWLVIDDVGLSTSPGLVQLILAQRYNESLPTIVTSGLERDQFIEHIGAATVRRIVEYEGRTRGRLVDCHERPAS